jgi:predicted nucleic acid-binding protein
LNAYADTSFLYSLYVQQVHSARAAACMAGAGGAPLPLTTFGRFELVNAIRLSVFRQHLDPQAAAADLQTIEADIGSGILEVMPCDWPAIHAEAERLSAKHTVEGGHRGMDILHVATALTADATDFLTFDRNQARLASAEGLRVKPD